jgi:hypothetical protein
MFMNVELVYNSGQTYAESINAGTARINHRAKRVTVWFKGNGKSRGFFSMTQNEAERLAHAILLASSSEETPVEFPFGETAKK